MSIIQIRRWVCCSVTVCAVAMISRQLPAQSPLSNLVPFKRVDADPNKSFVLTEKHGPWLIIASTFAGEDAESQAHELVIELRRDFKLPAYMHKHHFDFTDTVDGINKHRQKVKMKYASAVKFDEIAVMVGNFTSVDDPGLEKALQTVKHAKPKCLDLEKNQATTQRFSGYRNLWKIYSAREESKTRGPMGAAFATSNPLLPPEYFRTTGIDPLVKQMNRDAEFSLLKNKGHYTVRVATFSGNSTMFFRDNEELDKKKGLSMLEKAATDAHKLAASLRAKGVEAYEFHDRYESFVTIGSFDSDGTQQPNGSFVYQPAIQKVIDRYKGVPKGSPGQGAISYEPHRESGILFDMTPTLIKVPRESLGASYYRER
ncbi:MAG: hypothetical protein FJ295_08905 [Planctomycetes bacterium]|nr:hypothetical protein [Planctomycetota bacterium]